MGLEWVRCWGTVGEGVSPDRARHDWRAETSTDARLRVVNVREVGRGQSRGREETGGRTRGWLPNLAIPQFAGCGGHMPFRGRRELREELVESHRLRPVLRGGVGADEDGRERGVEGRHGAQHHVVVIPGEREGVQVGDGVIRIGEFIKEGEGDRARMGDCSACVERHLRGH